MANISHMTSKLFKDIYQSKGWTPKTLANRWGCSASRVHQIAIEVGGNHKKKNAYIDMVKGLPKKQT